MRVQRTRFVKSKIRNATSKNTHHDKDTDSVDKKRQKFPSAVQSARASRRVCVRPRRSDRFSSQKEEQEKKERRKNIEVKIARGGGERAFPVSFRATAASSSKRDARFIGANADFAKHHAARVIVASCKPARRVTLCAMQD